LVDEDDIAALPSNRLRKRRVRPPETHD